jgi:hypothetical protein
MRKPLTANLATLINERKAKLAQKAELEQKLLTNKAEREKAVAESKGSDDKAALSKIELLLAHREMTERNLELLGRELEGYKIRIGVEAQHIKGKAVEALQERREKVMARFRRKMEEFYPEPRDLERLIDNLPAIGSQIPEIAQINKRLTGLQSIFAPDICPAELGEMIRKMVDVAFVKCLPDEAQEQPALA